MHGKTKLAAAAAALAAIGTVGIWKGSGALAEDKPKDGGLVCISADDAKWHELIPGAWQAGLRGDPKTGPNASFTKFAPGSDHGWHTHSSDVALVVISGAYVYRDEQGEKRVGPRTYFFIPAGKKHWSGGDAKEGVVMYQESPGKFDVVKAEDGPSKK